MYIFLLPLMGTGNIKEYIMNNYIFIMAPSCNKQNKQTMDIETRLRLYMGNSYYHKTLVRPGMLSPNERPMVFCYSALRQKDFPENITTSYLHDLTRYIHPIPALHDTRFLLYPHDRVEPFPVPTLVKTRPINDFGESILLNLNYGRHFSSLFDVDKNDIPYTAKKDVLIWRGATTGYGFGNNIPPREASREILVQQYHNSLNPHLDIGLSEIIQSNKEIHETYKQYLKQSMGMQQMLQHKLILSVEGNDVATNMKWILHSNSVPICPPFTIQSWILENELIPWTHYIPIRADFWDMEDKVDWALAHPSLCESIAQNGREYMKPFLDVKRERGLIEMLLFRYAQNVHIAREE